MPKRKLIDAFTYRHRFAIAYVVVAAVLALLVSRAYLLLDGITAAEMASSIAAMHIGGLGTDTPYHALQSVSLHVFGFNALGIKAPSLLLGVITIISLLALIGRWTRQSIGIATALVFGAGTTFLTFAVTGSPIILYAFYPVVLLLLGTYVIQKSRLRYVALVALLAVLSLSLLTPGMAYIVAAGVVVGLLTPHIRYGLRGLGKVGGAGLIIGTVVALTPVVLSCIAKPRIIMPLLALPSSFNAGVLLTNGGRLATQFLSFFAPGFHDGLPAPMLGLAGFGLAVIGFVVTVRTLFTARSRFLASWLLVSIILSLVTPALAPLVYIVLIMHIGIALEWTARYWFRLFPLNPYARLFGLALIVLMVAGIVTSNVLRFAGTAGYSAGSRALYSHDLALVVEADDDEKGAPMILLVSERQTSFYEGLQADHPNITVASSLPAMTPGTYVVSSRPLDDRIATRIITDSRAQGSDRFYLYK